MCGFLRGCGLYQPSPPPVRFAAVRRRDSRRPAPTRFDPGPPPPRPDHRRAAPREGPASSAPGYPCRCRTRRPEPSERRRLRGETPRSNPETGRAARPATDSGLPGTRRHRGDRPGVAPRRPAEPEAPAPPAEVRIALRRRRGISLRKNRRPPGEVEGRPAAAKTDARRPSPVGRPAFHRTERRARAPLAVCYPAFALLRLAPPPLPAGASRASGPERGAAARGTGRGAVLAGSRSGERPRLRAGGADHRRTAPPLRRRGLEAARPHPAGAEVPPPLRSPPHDPETVSGSVESEIYAPPYQRLTRPSVEIEIGGPTGPDAGSPSDRPTRRTTATRSPGRRGPISRPVAQVPGPGPAPRPFARSFPVPGGKDRSAAEPARPRRRGTASRPP